MHLIDLHAVVVVVVVVIVVVVPPVVVVACHQVDGVEAGHHHAEEAPSVEAA